MPFDYKTVAEVSDKHPKPTYYQYQYGTAGFRTLYVIPPFFEADHITKYIDIIVVIALTLSCFVSASWLPFEA